MVGGVGQRMLTSVSRRMAGEFFGNVDAVLDRAPRRARPPAEPGRRGRQPGRRGSSPPAAAAAAIARSDDFLKGVAVGAGLVLARCAASGARRPAGADERPRPSTPTARDDGGRRRAPARSPRASCSTCTWPGSPSATRELNAIVSLDEERARAGAAAADEALASGADGRAAARAAVRVQGHPRGRRLAHDVRLAAASPTTCPSATSCSSSGSAAPAW